MQSLGAGRPAAVQSAFLQGSAAEAHCTREALSRAGAANITRISGWGKATGNRSFIRAGRMEDPTPIPSEVRAASLRRGMGSVRTQAKPMPEREHPGGAREFPGLTMHKSTSASDGGSKRAWSQRKINDVTLVFRCENRYLFPGMATICEDKTFIRNLPGERSRVPGPPRPRGASGACRLAMQPVV